MRTEINTEWEIVYRRHCDFSIRNVWPQQRHLLKLVL